MIEFGGFHYPDGEHHMIEWCKKHGVSMFGRTAYQGAKQKACIDLCTKLGRLRRAIDVGAHVGHWSFNLARYFDRVEAFEPVAAHRECWTVNMKEVESFRPALYDCALGDKPGRVRMQVEHGNSGNSSVEPGAAGDVDLFTLDSFEFQNVDFIKIDTEGFELAVLQGAQATIDRWRPVVVVEQKRTMAHKYGFPMLGAVQFLKDRGYKLVADLGGDFLCAPSEAMK